jgi:post-segregation antitoxin (ccd killing protein)
MRKSINTTIDNDLYTKIKVLALKLSAKNEKRVNANDLLEEGMQYILEKYQNLES